MTENEQVLGEIYTMRDEIRNVANVVAGLVVEVKHLTEELQITRSHGERLAQLETRVSNLEGDQRSAATERRWIVGLLIGSLLSILAIGVTLAAIIVPRLH